MSGTTTKSRRAVAAAAALVLAGGGALTACGDDSADDSDTSAGEESAASTVTVEDTWARPGTTGGNSAIYMDLVGGSEDDALVSAAVPSDVAATAEVHETVAAEGDDMEGMDGMDSVDDMSGDMDSGDGTSDDMESGDMEHSDEDADHGSGMMTMQEVSSIEVPAGETVALEPGGYHVMVLDLQEDLVTGDTIEVTLTFESGDEQTLEVEVKEA